MRIGEILSAASSTSGIAGCLGAWRWGRNAPDAQANIERAPSILRTIETHLAAEQDRWFPISIAAMSAGICVYFALSQEPSLSYAVAAFVIAVLLGLAARRMPTATLRFSLMCLAMAAFGFSIAKLRTE